MNNSVKEPFLHITKRREMAWQKAWAIRIGMIVFALILCAAITALTTELSPIAVYGTMFKGALGSARKVWVLGKELAILLAIALALTPAFRMKFWNLGGEGQVLMGCLATSACMIYLGKTLPNAVLIPVMLFAAVAAGADGLIIEVHPHPEVALSDGDQSLTPKNFRATMDEVRKIAAIMGRK